MITAASLIITAWETNLAPAFPWLHTGRTSIVSLVIFDISFNEGILIKMFILYETPESTVVDTAI